MNPSFTLAPSAHKYYAQSGDKQRSWLDGLAHSFYGKLNVLREDQHNIAEFISRVREAEKLLARLSDSRLREEARRLGIQLRGALVKPGAGEKANGSGFRKKQNSRPQGQAILAKLFASVVEASARTLSQKHYHCQLHGGLLLFRGTIAEMATGEGKTLTATLPAASAALMGVPTHVVSANDYLTARDAEEMLPLYNFLGLSVGCINSNTEQSSRREHYSRAITYCTNKDLAFDYLRDTLTLGDSGESIILHAEDLYRGGQRSQSLILRGLHYAIVDEADSVLIDDAKTPLVISASRGGEQEAEFMREAWALSQSLLEGQHFKVHNSATSVELTPEGKNVLASKAQEYAGIWQGRYRREAIIRQALAVERFYQRDKHYTVVDGKVQIVDENTGRILADRSWERGLHQLVEIKESCELTQQRECLAKISYQRFFRRYLHLAGMTGTASEVRGELWQTYHLKTAVVPRNKACKRRRMPAKIVESEDRQLKEIVAAVSRINKLQRPVLIGSASIADSEKLTAALTDAGLPCALLNAKQDREEAQIIAAAGLTRAITVATQMAGRGTDIKLSRESREAGGLHVILCQRFDAARIDRQLEGRCARQDDPGSYEELLCMEHMDGRNVRLRKIMSLLLKSGALRFRGGKILVLWLLRKNQKNIEKYHGRLRRLVFQQDDKLRELLAFSGKSE